MSVWTDSLPTSRQIVTQPRRPCFKLGARHGIPHLAAHLQATGRTGSYLQVLKPGTLEVGVPLTLVTAASHDVTGAEINRIMNVDRYDQAGIEHVLSASADLPPAWRIKLEIHLGNSAWPDDDRERLAGR